MNTMTRLLAAALLLCAASADAVEGESKRGDFHGVVHVAEDGRIRVETLDRVTGALADAVRSQVEVRRALPAMREGRPVASTAPVSGTFIVTLQGERADITLAHVALQPKAVQRTPFIYPIESMCNERAGWVEVEFGLDASGAPTDLRIVHASHPSFAKAVSKPLATWRFATQGVDPATRYRLTARFHTDEKKPTPEFECPHDSSRPRLDGQSGCVEGVEIHGSRVRRDVIL